MANRSTNDSPTESENGDSSRNIQAVVSRVLSLSIFFVGIGLYAALGFDLHQLALLEPYQVTYFTVGVAIGVVGLILWLITR